MPERGHVRVLQPTGWGTIETEEYGPETPCIAVDLTHHRALRNAPVRSVHKAKFKIHKGLEYVDIDVRGLTARIPIPSSVLDRAVERGALAIATRAAGADGKAPYWLIEARAELAEDHPIDAG